MKQVLLHSLLLIEEHGDAACLQAVEDALASGAVARRLQAKDRFEAHLDDYLRPHHAVVEGADDLVAFGGVGALIEDLVADRTREFLGPCSAGYRGKPAPLGISHCVLPLAEVSVGCGVEGGRVWDADRVGLPWASLDEELGDVAELHVREKIAPPLIVPPRSADEVPDDAPQDEDMAVAMVALPWFLGFQPLHELLAQAVPFGYVMSLVEGADQVQGVVEGDIEQGCLVWVLGQTRVGFQPLVKGNLQSELLGAEPRTRWLENARQGV